MLVVAVVIVSSITTWIAKEWIRSPAEIAAQTAPPAAAPILVPVVEQVLATKVVTRGTGRYGSPREISVPPRRHGFQPGGATDTQRAAARPLEAELVDGGSPSSGVQLPADEVIYVPT